MNVLHVGRQYLEVLGGTEKYIKELSGLLKRRGIKCRILAIDYNLFNKKQKYRKYELIDGIDVFRIPAFGYYKKPIPLSIPLEHLNWADIVHIHDLRFLYETVLLLKSVYKYKIIISTHGLFFHTKDLNSLKTIMFNFYYKPTIRTVIDKVICSSNQDYEILKGANLENVILVENGMTLDKFNGIKRIVKSGTFLYFGRIDGNKGLDLLFKVLAKLENNNWCLHIVGTGDENVIKRYKSISNDLKISEKIIWHGFLQEDKLLRFIAESQICFFPSRYEGFGYTLVEAMAAAAICIANQLPTYRSIINDNKNGFVIDFYDIEAASEKIGDILKKSQEELGIIGRNAKQKSVNYDWNSKIEEIINVYKNIK